MGNTPANLSTPESRQPMFGATSLVVLSRVSDRRDHGGVRILVTGHRGHVGAPVASFLTERGHEVAGFDRVEGKDLLDLAAVRGAAAGCEAIVHLAALAHDTAGSPEQIMAVNVLGTWHVLLAAEAVGVARVICFSSAQVFGIAEGERLPDYFPVDDAHPRPAAATTLGWQPAHRWPQREPKPRK
jgi:nucleoside-diphosphate-sugar epimerase